MILGLMLVGALAVSAQDAPPPVLAVLASVPDTPEARAYLTYADYAALTGGQMTEDSLIDAFMSSGLMSGPNLSYFEERIATQETLIGVSLFATAQGAEWGSPPEQTMLFQGEFDADAIAAAYAARAYTQEKAGTFLLFCGAAGCDAGSTVDIMNRNPGDPFGGELGAQRPVLFVPGGAQAQLMGSPSLPVLEANAAAAAGTAPSLAESPDYQAAVRAVTTGALLQAYFLSADVFGPAPEGAAPLTPYSLAVLAETDTEDGPLATVTLVFPSLADAEAAAPALETRLETLPLQTTGDSYAALLKERGILLDVQTSEDGDSGLGLVQMAFRAPDGDASVYRLLVMGLNQRNLPWLAIVE
jgi:hypothetical protein